MRKQAVFRDHYSEAIDPPGNLASLRAAVAAEPGAVMLESTAAGPWGRYSVYAMRPARRIECEAEEDVFSLLPKVGELRGMPPGAPFAGGWFGYLAYEAGRSTEPSAGWKSRKLDVPTAVWGLYETVLLHDHDSDTWSIAGVDLGNSGEGFKQSARKWRELVQHSSDHSDGELHATVNGAVWTPDQKSYLAQVERAIEYIRAGDIYQVNLARRMRTNWNSPAHELYERLCGINPASHSAYVGIAPGKAIVSASPELYLEVRDGIVTTRPIKGTRPRTGQPAADEQARRELATSPKERAELSMIIDLQRNDLGRVCETGTVRVESDGEIEVLPTVFHRTATVTGRLREDCGPVDLLRATFPGGSVTGAPKVRAMQIIQEMEPFARGSYCGAIGWIGAGGDMTLSLPIRTMLVHDGVADLFVGSGIVADSDPASELAELEAKAAGMMAAIHGDGGLRRMAEMAATSR